MARPEITWVPKLEGYDFCDTFYAPTWHILDRVPTLQEIEDYLRRMGYVKEGEDNARGARMQSMDS